MRTSCRFAMAIHVLALIAEKERPSAVSPYLARSVNTHPVIIRRLLLTLQQAHLVESRKGAGLGSRLMRPPARITLADVYRAVEQETLFAMPRQSPNRACPIGCSIQHALAKVFAAAQRALEAELSKTSLETILRSVQQRRRGHFRGAARG